MRKSWTLVGVLGLAVSLTVLPRALAAGDHDHDHGAGSGPVAIKGELVDSLCYVAMGAKGKGHKQCAIDCIKGGLPAGILEDKTNNVYSVVPKSGMEGPSKDLASLSASKVTLTGVMMEKGGQKLFIYNKIEAVKE